MEIIDVFNNKLSQRLCYIHKAQNIPASIFLSNCGIFSYIANN